MKEKKVKKIIGILEELKENMVLYESLSYEDEIEINQLIQNAIQQGEMVINRAFEERTKVFYDKNACGS